MQRGTHGSVRAEQMASARTGLVHFQNNIFDYAWKRNGVHVLKSIVFKDQSESIKFLEEIVCADFKSLLMASSFSVVK